MLLGEICATQMSHHVALSSPTSSSPSPCYWSRAFSPHNTNLHRSHGKMMRGAHKRCHVILAHASLSDKDINHRFPKSSRRHINRHALADVSLPCCLKVPSLFSFYFIVFISSSVHMRGNQMGLFSHTESSYGV